jgi:hypothetical protein
MQEAGGGTQVKLWIWHLQVPELFVIAPKPLNMQEAGGGTRVTLWIWHLQVPEIV